MSITFARRKTLGIFLYCLHRLTCTSFTAWSLRSIAPSRVFSGECLPSVDPGSKECAACGVAMHLQGEVFTAKWENVSGVKKSHLAVSAFPAGNWGVRMSLFNTFHLLSLYSESGGAKIGKDFIIPSLTPGRVLRVDAPTSVSWPPVDSSERYPANRGTEAGAVPRRRGKKGGNVEGKGRARWTRIQWLGDWAWTQESVVQSLSTQKFEA